GGPAAGGGRGAQPAGAVERGEREGGAVRGVAPAVPGVLAGVGGAGDAGGVADVPQAGVRVRGVRVRGRVDVGAKSQADAIRTRGAAALGSMAPLPFAGTPLAI